MGSGEGGMVMGDWYYCQCGVMSVRKLRLAPDLLLV